MSRKTALFEEGSDSRYCPATYGWVARNVWKLEREKRRSLDTRCRVWEEVLNARPHTP